MSFGQTAEQYYNQTVTFINNFDYSNSNNILTSPLYPIFTPLCYLFILWVLTTITKWRGKGLDLKPLVALHNFISCLGSLIMFCGLMYSLIRRSIVYGFWDIYCDPLAHLEHFRGDLAFWCYVFYVSKYYELLDSFFLAIRDKELSFLHVYHHFIVIPLFWIYNSYDCLAHWMLVATNTFIHIFMYYYYTLATYGKSVWWKKYITIGQMVQFWIDMISTWPFILMWAFHTRGICSTIEITWPVLFGQGIGFSFFLLFYKLYRESYYQLAAGKRLKKTQ